MVHIHNGLLLLLLSRFSRVQLCATPETAAHQASRPWDSPGKNTGVGCHFLLQCMKVKSESEIAQSCPSLCDPMDCRLPGSSVHGILQARVLEWGAIAFSIKKNWNILFGEEGPFLLQLLSFSAEVQLFTAQLNIWLPNTKGKLRRLNSKLSFINHND